MNKDRSSSSEYNAEFEKTRIRILFQQNGATQASSLVIAGIYFYTYRDVVRSELLLPWAFFFIFLLAARIYFSFFFIKKFINAKKDFDPILWERFFTIGVFLSGLTWAVAGSILLPLNSISHCAIMGFILSGLTAGASVAYSTSLLSAQIFLLCSVVPYFITLSVAQDPLQHSMAGMVLCYLIVYSLLAVRINRYAVNAIKLGFEKDKLLDQAKKNKEHLSQSEDRLKEAQRIAHIGNTEVNLITGESYWSDEAFRIFELDPKENTPSRDIYYSIIHPEERLKVKSDFEGIVKTGISYEGDRRLITKAGKLKNIFVKSVPEIDKNGKVTLIRSIIIDVSERKKTEIAVAQNFKMSALGEMAGGIAHEINSPLTIICSRATQLKHLLPDNELAIKWIDIIESTSFRIAKIIKGLLVFAKEAEHEPFESVSVDEIVEDTFSICQERFKSNGIDLRSDIAGDLKLECRKIQICQVLLALLSNAFDGVSKLQDKWVLVSAKNQNDHIELSVTDSGHGISAEIQGKIMQPFFSTKEVGKGMGLGLSISKGIVESHHGLIEVDPSSKNTRFVVVLPKMHAQKLAG